MNAKLPLLLLGLFFITSCALQTGNMSAKALGFSARQDYANALHVYEQHYEYTTRHEDPSLNELITQWGQLAQSYPPAKISLEARRDFLKVNLITQSHNRKRFQTFLAINEALFQNEISYLLFTYLYQNKINTAEFYYPDFLKFLTKNNACVETNPMFESSHGQVVNSSMSGRGVLKKGAVVDRHRKLVVVHYEDICQVTKYLAEQEKVNRALSSNQSVAACDAPQQ